MTLVELLVTITILAILGSAVLFASFSANQAARVAATRAKVGSLHSLVMEKYEEYAVRRVDDIITPPLPNGTPQMQVWEHDSEVRLKALRAVMRMEMPDRWSDIIFAPVESTLPGQIDVGNPAQYARLRLEKWNKSLGVKRTTLSHSYLRRYAGLNKDATAQQILANEGAECLYMIVTLATADGEALSLFRQSDIGDVDGDGAPEFLDAWGRPIHFLHAAPGFLDYSDLQSGNAASDPDPFDHYRVDVGAYRLVPLIYSAGSDGDPDLATLRGDVNPLAGRPPMDLKYHAAPLVGIGTPLSDDVDQDVNEDENDGDNWLDNIHNHDQSVRQ